MVQYSRGSRSRVFGDARWLAEGWTGPACTSSGLDSMRSARRHRIRAAAREGGLGLLRPAPGAVFARLASLTRVHDTRFKGGRTTASLNGSGSRRARGTAVGREATSGSRRERGTSQHRGRVWRKVTTLLPLPSFPNTTSAPWRRWLWSCPKDPCDQTLATGGTRKRRRVSDPGRRLSCHNVVAFVSYLRCAALHTLRPCTAPLQCDAPRPQSTHHVCPCGPDPLPCSRYVHRVWRSTWRD